MKVAEPNKKPFGETLEEHRQAEIKKQLNHLGSTPMQAGHTMFEFNFVTGELEPATIHREVHMVNGEGVTRSKIITKENCQYIPFLNRKSAIRKLKRYGLWKH